MKRILFLGIFFSLFSLSATWQKEDVQLLKDCIGRDFGMFSKGAKNLKQAQDVNDFQYEHGKEVLNETKEEFLKKYQSDFIENKDNQAILYMIQGFSSEVEERFVNCTEDVEKEHAQKKEHLKRLDAMAKIVAYKVKEELKKENIYFGGWTEPKMYLLLTKRSWIINEALN
ncbi:hypothetical protein K9K77_01255, partial [Candidatus Babeliales bacterium]|nr:hypothetical protein [Candidatus Babeliales bacterium]